MSTPSNIYHSLANELAIKTIFGAVLGGFNDCFNVLNNEFELEKSGLSDYNLQFKIQNVLYFEPLDEKEW